MLYVPLKHLLRSFGTQSTNRVYKPSLRRSQVAKTGILVPYVTDVSKGALENFPLAERFPVIAAADGLRTRLTVAVTRLLEVLADQVTIKELAEAIEAGGVNELWRVLDIDNRLHKISQGSGLQPNENSLIDVLQQVFSAGAEAELESLKKIEVQKAKVGVEMLFDMLNMESVTWLQSYTFSLIREVSIVTRAAVQDVILEAFKTGGHPYAQAKTIKSFIGLTQSQAKAVMNFKKMLESGDPTKLKGVLERALRDKRFDSTVLSAVKQQTVLPQHKIDDMVARYQARYIKYRAENIARTETLRAANAGQQAAWKSAQQQGLLRADKTRQKWLVTKDDRLCPSCKPIPGLNPQGVVLGGQFITPLGPATGPPLHPSCRCAIGLIFT